MDHPERILNVSMGFFSVARYYGAAVFEGKRYIYVPEKDELVREDIHKKEQKKLAKRKQKSG